MIKHNCNLFEAQDIPDPQYNQFEPDMGSALLTWEAFKMTI
jgi:hypothetical protein